MQILTVLSRIWRRQDKTSEDIFDVSKESCHVSNEIFDLSKEI
jgi:hypothetical protein